MSYLIEFDIENSPLNGSNLIEANAGCGKTYAIAAIFLRLLIEKELLVENIVVVSFTEAASEELKLRIYKNLKEAKSFLEGNLEESECSLSNYLKKFKADNDKKKEVLGKIDLATNSFYQANVSTIHSFCAKIISDYPFETNVSFDFEFCENEYEFLLEIAEDFWRIYIYNIESLTFLNYIRKQKPQLSPQYFLTLIKNITNFPNVKIIPDVEKKETCDIEQKILSLFEELLTIWEKDKETISKILLTNEGLNRNSYRIPSIEKWVKEITIGFELGLNEFLEIDIIEKFSSENLKGKLKKNSTPYEFKEPFFVKCEEFLKIKKSLFELYDNTILYLKKEFIKYIKQESVVRKEKKNLIFYDDFLSKTKLALEKGNSGSLNKILNNRYKAALIDEFQDTNLTQYEIFKNIFKDNILFFIGDPKQSIYGFRGADIFAYLKASKTSQNKYFLIKNYRSELGLINAVNDIFSYPKNTFIYDEIKFSKSPADKKKETFPSLSFFLLDKKKKESLLHNRIVLEILRLFNEKNKKPNDIAVICETNETAIKIKQALILSNIPSIVYFDKNLFETEEALELERILYAILNKNNLTLIKSALITNLMGKDTGYIKTLNENEQKLSKTLESFNYYNQLWHEQSFSSMFKEFLKNENIINNLISLEDSKRKITNIFHIRDILIEKEYFKNLKFQNLFKWFSKEISSKGKSLKEYELELESDKDAVKVLTIHRSKGLEFNIVFSIFLRSNTSQKKPNNLFFHNEKEYTETFLDIGSKDFEENRKKEDKESLAEKIRVFYVALTRAKELGYVFLINDNTNILNFILFRNNVENSDFYEKLTQITQNNNLIDVKKIDEEIPITIKNERDSDNQTVLKKKEFKQKNYNNPIIQSFSSITENETQEEYSSNSLFYKPKETKNMLSLPRGKKTGNLIHSILDNLNFQNLHYEKDIIASKLKEFNFDPLEWTDVIYENLDTLFKIELKTDDLTFSLNEISPSKKINELEFYYSSDEQKFMHGFIDLVFEYKKKLFVIDWKTNFLGDDFSDYNEKALEENILKHSYNLQAEIYLSAIKKYLQFKTGKEDVKSYIGGVFYIFLRGIKEDTNYGIFNFDKLLSL